MIDIYSDSCLNGISSILTPCSARKEQLPTPALQIGQLPVGTQRAVAREWVKRLSKSPGFSRRAARDLYSGGGFRRLRSVADKFECQLFVLSAGLGLVASTTRVPAYDLTVSPSAKESLQDTISEAFAPKVWWDALQAGPFASPLTEVGHGEARILVALTQPYARLVGAALAELPPNVIDRMRVFGAGILRFLPDTLHKQVVRYDTRLDVLSPGTRLDASSRALAHFATLVSHRSISSVDSDHSLVDVALASFVRREVIKRPRLSDAELHKHVLRLARRGLSATSALKQLRSKACVACEEQRFRRAYEEAMT